MKVRNKFLTKFHFIIIFLLVTFLLMSFWLTKGIQFSTNDDTNFMYLYAGYRTGEFESSSISQWFLWGKIVSTLYKICESIPWYSILYMALIYISLLIIGYAFVEKCVSNVDFLFSTLIFFTIIVSIFARTVIALNFTTISATLMSAALCMLVSEFSCSDYTGCRCKLIFAGILFFFACNIRERVSYVGIAVAIGLLIAAFLLRFNKHRVRKALLYCIVFGVSLFISYLANLTSENQNGMREFRTTYHKERRLFTDYEKLPYKGNEDFYLSIGWDETLYNVASEWFFMDENVNYYTFKSIEEQKENVNSTSSWLMAINTFKKIYILRRYAFVWGVFGLVLFFLAIRFRESLAKEFAFQILYFLGTTAICLYIARDGRFPERIENMMVFICFVPAILSYKNTIHTSIECNYCWRKNYFMICTVAISLVVMIIGIKTGFSEINSIKMPVEDYEKARESERYCIENPENLYIYDIYMNCRRDPFTIYPEEKPVNMMFWGGVIAYSPMYYKQLLSNGYNELYSDDFFNEDIYFLGCGEPDAILVEYMKKRYENCECIITEDLGNFIVYKFRKD